MHHALGRRARSARRTLPGVRAPRRGTAVAGAPESLLFEIHFITRISSSLNVYLGICILVIDRILVFSLLIAGAAGVSVRAHLPFGVLPRTVVFGVLARARLAGRLMGNVG